MENVVQKNERDLYNGKILAQNHLYHEAIACLKKVYKSGNHKIAYEIGRLYMKSEVKDYKRAFRWLLLGAENGDSNAQYYLSKFYEFNLLDKYNLSEAYKWLSSAARQNEKRALYRLAFWYRTGHFVKKDEKKSWELLQQSADLGYPEACFQVGQEFETGNSFVASDTGNALKYYEQAAIRHQPDALFRLGRYYWEGNDLRKSALHALKYLEESCRKGCTAAQYYMATICGTGSYRHSFNRYVFLQAAAKGNHVQAMYDLGCLFLFGNNFISRNQEKADFWLQKAGKCGCEEALDMYL